MRREHAIEMPDLAVLRDALAGDGTLSTREMQELRSAIRFISSVEWTPAPDNVHAVPCTQCGEILTVNPQMNAPFQAPATCLSCWFWLERCAMSALVSQGAEAWHPGTIRALGQHYALLPMPLDLRKASEVVTVVPYLPSVEGPKRLPVLSRMRLVTPRLYCQGAVPEAYREYLPDNATLMKGDPYKLGIGFHELGKDGAGVPPGPAPEPTVPTV